MHCSVLFSKIANECGILKQITDTKFENVPVRIYEPLTKERYGPGVVFYHGGGWIVLSVGKLLGVKCLNYFFLTGNPFDFFTK